MRTVGSSRSVTEQAIREAAVEAISRYGFHATSLRMLAKEVGIQAGSLYNYISSKEEFLTNLIQETLEHMLQTLATRLDGVSSPVICLLEFVWLHLELHTDESRQKEIIIGNLELRNLSEAYYKRVTDLRDRYSNELTRILIQGNAAGALEVADPRVACFAMLSMLTGVSYWYREGGRVGRSQVMEEHTVFALRMVKVKVPQKALQAFFARANTRMQEVSWKPEPAPASPVKRRGRPHKEG